MLGRRIVKLAPRCTRLSSSITPSIANAVTPALRPASIAPTAQQAPNKAETWSRNQRSRADALSGPRFEQTSLEFQPQPMSAMQLVSEDPIRMVNGRKASCDGGSFPGTFEDQSSYLFIR